MAQRAAEASLQLHATMRCPEDDRIRRSRLRGKRIPVDADVERRIAAFVSPLERLPMGAIMLATLLPTFELSHIVR